MIRKQPIDLPFTPFAVPYAHKVDVQSILSRADGISTLSTQRLILHAEGKVDLHSDPTDQQILVFTGKGAIYDKDDSKTVAVDGDVFFINANTPFRIENEGKTPLVLIITSTA